MFLLGQISKFLRFQDIVRNQLIQFELLLTTATFVVAIFGVVAGVFGMNFATPFFDEPEAFERVLVRIRGSWCDYLLHLPVVLQVQKTDSPVDRLVDCNHGD